MSYSTTDAAIDAARTSISNARAGSGNASLGDTMLKGGAIGAVVSIPLAGVGLVGGALLGAGVAAVDKLTRS